MNLSCILQGVSARTTNSSQRWLKDQIPDKPVSSSLLVTYAQINIDHLAPSTVYIVT